MNINELSAALAKAAKTRAELDARDAALSTEEEGLLSRGDLGDRDVSRLTSIGAYRRALAHQLKQHDAHEADLAAQIEPAVDLARRRVNSIGGEIRAKAEGYVRKVLAPLGVDDVGVARVLPTLGRVHLLTPGSIAYRGGQTDAQYLAGSVSLLQLAEANLQEATALFGK